MALPPDSQEDRAAFVEACVKKRKKALQVWESLGLTSERIDDLQRGTFSKKEANELQEAIEQIANGLAISYRGKMKELKFYLLDENAFSDDVRALGKKYGASLWGRLEDGMIRQSQGKWIEEYNWDDARDRNTILFYIRCWIICVVTTPRRGKGKGRARESDISEDQQNQVVAGLTDYGSCVAPVVVAFRAPEPPRMHPTPESRREATSTSTDGMASSTFLGAVAYAESKNTTTPSKRKAHDAHGRAPSGKLPRPLKSARTVLLSPKLQGNTYSTPDRPPLPQFWEEQRDRTWMPHNATAVTETIVGEKGPSVPRLGRHQREATYDTDATYMPQEATADTEMVIDGEEILPGEVGKSSHPRKEQAFEQTHNTDSCLQNAIAMTNEDDDTTSDACNNAVIQSLISESEPESRQNRFDRHELLKLLVSYLIGIKPFNANSHDFAAEKRMEHLLNHFQCVDAETWPLNQTVFRLALQTWMSMRHRLKAFRSATGFFGQPGQQWEEFLQGLDSVSHAEAVLAFVELKDDREAEEGRGVGARQGFDENLMVVFDGLTRMKGCNGSEAFKGVKRFNEALLKWFEE